MGFHTKEGARLDAMWRTGDLEAVEYVQEDGILPVGTRGRVTDIYLGDVIVMLDTPDEDVGASIVTMVNKFTEVWQPVSSLA